MIYEKVSDLYVFHCILSNSTVHDRRGFTIRLSVFVVAEGGTGVVVKDLIVKPVDQVVEIITNFPTITGTVVLFEDDVNSEKHYLCNEPSCTSTAGEAFVSDYQKLSILRSKDNYITAKTRI